MKNTTKKVKMLLAFLLSMAMVLSFSTAVFADGETSTTHTITITNSDSKVQHTYEAYQVFAGTLDGTQLTMLKWGSGVDGDALLTALKADTTLGASFAGCKTAADVANILSGFDNDSTTLDVFAKIVGQNLATAAATSAETATPYTLSVSGDGYYFVKDKSGSVTEDGESYSKYMLKVIKDETIEAKDDQLTPTKKIVEGESRVDENSAAIGDTITYEISIPIPKMDGYDTYYFQMQDTLDEGLTYQSISSVKVGDKTLTTDDYTLDAPTTNGGTLTITYKTFIQYKGTSGNVVVTYTAKLNENAKLDTSNDNTVKYVYSNDPSHSGGGKTNPDEPDDSNPKGTTPEDTVKTWVTQLQLLKTGDNGTVEKLAGAQFTLTGDALNTVLLSGTKFEASDYTAATGEKVEAGTYYKLKDGTYTTTAATTQTASQYEDTETTYVLVTFSKLKTEAASTSVTAVTGEDGTLSFVGLNAGTYTLTEDIAPSGYNQVDAIKFTIEWNEKDGFKVSDTSGVTYDKESNTFKITVDNKSGAVLPSTGGMGTTLFYVFGVILAVGAAILLITKRRVNEVR